MKTLWREELVAPHLMWSEASSVLHELRWRKEISDELASIVLERLAASVPSCVELQGLTLPKSARWSHQTRLDTT